MLPLDGKHGADSGLAHSLDEPSPSLAQNSAVILSPRNANCATVRLESPGYGSLSADQVRADWILRDVSDIEFQHGLKEARTLVSDYAQQNYTPGDTLQETSFTYLSSSGQVRQNPHAPAGRASPNLAQIEGSYQSTFDASRIHPQRAPDKIDTSQEVTETANLYWCTICKDRRPYKKVSAWRKHENEHVNKYVCMLRGPLDEIHGCVKCCLCGMSNPNEEHLSTHNTQICEQRLPGSFSCKRRADMVKHLKNCHNVPEKAQGEAVAAKWKETTKKQAWSCGFCVDIFYTFGDRLKHIAKHFASGQTLDEWSTTNVIEGLLLQPGIMDVWSMPLGWRSLGSIWKKDVVEKLQHDLELGPSDPMHATALVETVYNAGRSDWHLLNDDRPFTFAPIHGAQGPSALAPASGHDSSRERVFQPSSNHEQPQFINPAETLHNDVPAPGGDPMATYDYDILPGSFSDEDSSSVEAPWQRNPGQTWSSAADRYFGYTVNQELSNATTGRHTWMTPAMSSDDPNANDMLA